MATALRLVVIDPELRLFLRQRIRDLLHGSCRLFLVGIYRGYATVIPVLPEMDGIAGQHDRAGVWQFHQ